VFGLAVAFGIISWSLSRSNILTVETTMGYYKYSTARNIARTAINLGLRKIDENEVNPNMIPIGSSQLIINNLNVSGGKVDSLKITILTDSTFLFHSRASCVDTSYKIITELQRYPKPFPGINAAVGLNVNNAIFDMKGQAKIYGTNHDVDGNLISPSVPENDKPGVEVLVPADSVEAATDSSKIFGYPTKIKVNPGMANPADFVAEYISGANYSYGAGTYPQQTWGSETNPVIVFCDGSSGTVHFSGKCEGWGVLVVKGSLKATGQFTFRGLVVPYSDTIIDFNPFSGQAHIIGAVLMGGATGSSFEMKGRATVKYSSDALSKAKMIGQLMFYKILSWYENY
ncbi:MAG: hypothetical protein KKB77_11440, partial [Bacteroidetes bacterium]|nr:hypothetical protein [Bacteroidota bacterium]